MNKEQAQKVADKIKSFPGVEEVLWLQIPKRMTEFYIVMNSEQSAMSKKQEIQFLANDHPRSRFAVLPKGNLLWGYASTRQ
jgi:hypothetical protein